jgi:hypothetical protein
MRAFGVGLAVALMLGFFCPTARLLAAPAVPAALAVSKDQRTKGMAAAPDLIKAAGLDCQLSDARFIGEGKDTKTKATNSLYEVACTGNEGALIQKASDGTVQFFTCTEAATPKDGKPSTLTCILPGNEDPKAGLVPYIAKSGVQCTPSQVRGIGHNATATVFEVKCASGDGYILETSAPPRLDKPVTMNPCIGYDPTLNVHCELTDRTAQMAVVDRLASQSGKDCTVKDRRFIGASQASGSMFYEVSCQNGKGYVLQTSASNQFQKAIACADADAIAGGCTLTDTRQAKTEQAGLYTQLAHKAGFQCDVSGYAPFSVSLQGKEVVELVCSNRPDGGIGVFATGAGTSVVYDCAHSELENFRCSLTKAQAAYPTLTADLRKLGKTSCAVSNARTVGITADQKGYIEVACADGLPGYMIQYSTNPLAPEKPLVCAEAKGIGGGCTLPGNKVG